MRITYKEYEEFESCSTFYEIKYKSRSSSGVIKVKTKFYDRFIKKFNKLFKDTLIISMEEKVGIEI